MPVKPKFRVLLVVPLSVKNKLVPSYSIAPASGAVRTVLCPNFREAVPAAAVPAGSSSLALGVEVPRPTLPALL